MPIVGSSWRIYEVKDYYTIGSTECLSTWFYRITIVSQPSAAQLATNFASEVLDNLVDVQGDNVNHHTLEVIDYMDDSNFGTFSIDVDGSISISNALPHFVCAGLRLLRSSRDMRSGWKRIGGQDESQAEGNQWSSAYKAILDSKVSGIIQDINIDLVALQLVVVRNRPTVSDPDIDPEDATTWRYTNVLSGEWVPYVTTQNSRKVFS